MVIDNKYFAIIPARKGSKGIINKNMQIIGEKPMILFTMEAALKAKQLNNIILSSDDQNIIIINQEKKDTIENKNLLESDDEEINYNIN